MLPTGGNRRAGRSPDPNDGPSRIQEVYPWEDSCCILCGGMIPVSDFDYGSPDWEEDAKLLGPWRLDIIGFYNVTGDGPDTHGSDLSSPPHNSEDTASCLHVVAVHGRRGWIMRDARYLRYPGGADITPVLFSLPRNHPRVTFARVHGRPPPIAERRTASMFLVHTCCWRAAREISRYGKTPPDSDDVTFANLYVYGRSTQTIIPFCTAYDYDTRVDMYTQSALDLPDPDELPLLRQTPLGSLLWRVGTALPAELRQTIYGHLSDEEGITYALIRALQTTRHMLSMNIQNHSRLCVIHRPRKLFQFGPLAHPEPAADVADGPKPDESPGTGTGGDGFLVARQTSLFGDGYLQDLRFISRDQYDSQKTESKSWSLEIEVPCTAKMKGVDVWLGPRGVRAMALHYIDGSRTPWLGRLGHRAPDQCFQSLLVNEAEQLASLYSFEDVSEQQRPSTHPDLNNNMANKWKLPNQDFKLCRVGFSDILFRDAPDMDVACRALWRTDTNVEVPRTGDMLCVRLENYGQLMSGIYEDRVLFDYLPLMVDGRHATGLTAYYGGNDDCFSGLTAHFGNDAASPEYTIGRRKKEKQHCPFSPGEYITYAALLVQKDVNRSMPLRSILIMTNHRRQYLLSRDSPRIITHKTSVLPVHDSARRAVRGLFTDIWCCDKSTRATLGVCIDEPPASPEEDPANPYSPLDTIWKYNMLLPIYRNRLYSSMPVVNNIRRIVARKVGDRTVGILVELTTRALHCLGAWSPSREEGVVFLTVLDQETGEQHSPGPASDNTECTDDGREDQASKRVGQGPGIIHRRRPLPVSALTFRFKSSDDSRRQHPFRTVNHDRLYVADVFVGEYRHFAPDTHSLVVVNLRWPQLDERIEWTYSRCCDDICVTIPERTSAKVLAGPMCHYQRVRVLREEAQHRNRRPRLLL